MLSSLIMNNILSDLFLFVWHYWCWNCSYHLEKNYITCVAACFLLYTLIQSRSVYFICYYACSNFWDRNLSSFSC
jgi:hypothetical protein